MLLSLCSVRACSKSQQGALWQEGLGFPGSPAWEEGVWKPEGRVQWAGSPGLSDWGLWHLIPAGSST